MGSDPMENVGEIKSGAPSFDFPLSTIGHDRIIDLIPSAFLIGMISVITSMDVVNRLSLRGQYDISANQEMRALGWAGVIGACFGAIPIQGEATRTALNTQNAKTPVAGLVAALVVLFSLLFLTDMLYFMPRCVLASIIICGAVDLIDFQFAVWLMDLQPVGVTRESGSSASCESGSSASCESGSSASCESAELLPLK
jgi:SulP family sulfate permease